MRDIAGLSAGQGEVQWHTSSVDLFGGGYCTLHLERLGGMLSGVRLDNLEAL